MDALQSQVSGRVLLFARRYEFTSEAQSQLDILGQQLVGLQELAAALETELTIQLEGFADGLGTPDENREIALMRARTLQSELSERGVLTASMTVSAGEWVEGDENPDQRKVVIQINRESAR
jgi:outer membrane protein OmpA-like peptidoglycan-associated protein